jgi:hypothetical protein
MLDTRVAEAILARERAAVEALAALRAGGVVVDSERGDEYVLAILRVVLSDIRATKP